MRGERRTPMHIDTILFGSQEILLGDCCSVIDRDLMVESTLREKYLCRELSHAKAQSATAFLRVFFAPLRLCVRHIRFPPGRPIQVASTFRAKIVESTRQLAHTSPTTLIPEAT